MSFRQTVREVESIAMKNANGNKALALRMLSMSQGLAVSRENDLAALCLAKKRLAGV